jgi:hypothetical protein
MSTYKSKVLNLYSADEVHHFRIVPSDVDVQITHDNGVLPVDFPLLSTQGVDVHEKMFDNSSNLSAEISRAQNAEAVIQDNLDEESGRAVNAETAIQAELTAEKDRLVNQEAYEAGVLATETANRIAGDNALQNSLTNESNFRIAADAQHTTDISNEALRATTEEQRIEGVLNDYKTSNDAKVNAGDAKHDAYETYANGRMDAIEAKSVSDGTANADALAVEVKARQDEVARVDGRIDFITNNSDPASIDSLNELLVKFTNDGASYADRLTALEGVVAALVEQLGN